MGTISNELPGDEIASFIEQAYQAISSAIAQLELKLSQTRTQDRLARWLAILPVLRRGVASESVRGRFDYQQHRVSLA